jgi:DNA-binding MarR family transcriptional regulator
VDLAQELGVTPSTATRMCDRLARKGLVTRHTRTHDRRAVWVALTAAGRDLVGEATRLRRTAITELVHELAITRPVAFASVLDAFVEAAGEVPEAEFRRRWAGAAVGSPPPSGEDKSMHM